VSPTRLPQLGSVVWAELEDANGFRKVRPAVVVTATADIAAGLQGVPDSPELREGRAATGLQTPPAQSGGHGSRPA
jgi:hypothetical protein